MTETLPSNPPERDTKILQCVLAQLSEHFDTAQVFVTRYEPQEGNTVTANRGTGNFHARTGQVREWLVKADELGRIETRKDND